MSKLWIDLRGVILLFLSLALIFVMMNCNVRHLENATDNAEISTSYEK